MTAADLSEGGSNSAPNRLFSDAVFLAGVTFLGYLVVFYFEKGRFEYFSLPLDLIELSLTSVLVVITGVWVGVFFILNGTYVIFQGIGGWSHLKRKIAGFVVFCVWVSLNCSLNRCERTSWIWSGALVLAFAAFEFLWPPIFSYKGSYSEKLEQSDRFESRVTDLMGALVVRLGRPVFLIFLLLLLGIPLVRGAGYTSAANQKSFPVYVNGQTRCAVVALYDGNMVCVGFDEQTFQTTGEFLLVPISGPMVIENKKVGPLKIVGER